MDEQLEIETLKKLLDKKKLEVYSNKDNILDREKIYALEKLFNNNTCFFNIKFEVAISILKFLGINDNEIMDTYRRLVDPSLIILKKTKKN